MDFEFDGRTILHPDSEHPNLYRWSLREAAFGGSASDTDQIPWKGEIEFIVSEVELVRSITVGSDEADAGAEVLAGAGHTIRAKLLPAEARPIFSMFGTARRITDILLVVRELQSEAEKQDCRAWGMVRHTFELEFRDETMDDRLVFYLGLRPSSFSPYAQLLEGGRLTSASFRVSGVSGFYSEWSPSISADLVKVLIKNTEHLVEVPPGCGIEPPRLGEVLEATLEFHRLVRVSAD